MMKAVITGASGLVGSALMQQLCERREFDQIISLVRHRSETVDRKVTEILINFDKLPEIPANFSANCAFCCLGTTLKTAGSKDEQYKVDHDYVLGFAETCKKLGVSFFSVVSSIGASAKSGNFYLRTKGEMERDVFELHFPRTIILRPSFLLGNRREYRLGEKVGIGVIKAFSYLSFGTMDKYKGIRAEQVAERMILEALSKKNKGEVILESDEIAAHQQTDT